MTKKCFFTCIYRNPSIENNSSEKIDQFSTELGNTLNNINGKNYKKYVKNNFDPGYKQLLDDKIQQSSKLVMDAKERYFSEQGKKPLDPSLGAKKYWSILNNFLQKKNIPIIPPLWENGIFVSDCADKAELFNNFFASQSTPPPPLTQVLSYLNFN